MLDPQDMIDGLPGEMTQADFANLAIACLDQAGLGLSDQVDVRALVTKRLGLYEDEQGLFEDKPDG